MCALAPPVTLILSLLKRLLVHFGYSHLRPVHGAWYERAPGACTLKARTLPLAVAGGAIFHGFWNSRQCACSQSAQEATHPGNVWQRSSLWSFVISSNVCRVLESSGVHWFEAGKFFINLLSLTLVPDFRVLHGPQCLTGAHQPRGLMAWARRS
eukprot:2222273-Amphidinium_carterae.1